MLWNQRISFDGVKKINFEIHTGNMGGCDEYDDPIHYGFFLNLK